MPFHRSRRLAIAAGVLTLSVSVAALVTGPAQASTNAKSPIVSTATHQTPGASGAITNGHAPGQAKRVPATPGNHTAATPRQAVYYYGPITVAAYTAEWIEVYCPSGTLATSGGESNSSSGSVTLRTSYGLSNGGGWHADVTNDSGASESVTAYTVCLSGLTAYSQWEETDTSVLPNNDIAYHPMWDCPAGQSVVGGGVLSNSLALTIGEMSPGNFETPYYRGFETQVTNTDPVSAVSATSQEICAAGINNYSLWEGSVQVAPGGYSLVTETCPAGTFVVGGGGDGGWPFRYTDSRPSGNGWGIWAANAFDSATDSLYAEVICGT